MLILVLCCGLLEGVGGALHNMYIVKFWMLVVTGPNTSSDLFQLQVL